MRIPEFLQIERALESFCRTVRHGVALVARREGPGILGSLTEALLVFRDIAIKQAEKKLRRETNELTGIEYQLPGSRQGTRGRARRYCGSAVLRRGPHR